jgi:hypothetical protein
VAKEKILVAVVEKNVIVLIDTVVLTKTRFAHLAAYALRIGTRRECEGGGNAPAAIAMTTERQILEDANHLIAVWNERLPDEALKIWPVDKLAEAPRSAEQKSKMLASRGSVSFNRKHGCNVGRPVVRALALNDDPRFLGDH